MIFRVVLFVFMAYQVTYFQSVTYGDDRIEKKPLAKENEEKNEINFVDYVDNTHNLLSRKVFLLSNTLDSLFGGRPINEDRNSSSFRVWYQLSKVEGNDIISRPDFKLRIKLPYTQKKLKIVFEKSSIEERAPTKVNQDQVNSTIQSADQKLAASLKYTFKFTPKWSLTSNTGVRVGIPPNLFARLNGRFVLPLGKWDLRAEQQVFWYSKDGLGESSTISIGRKFLNNFSFSFGNFATWLDDDSSFRFGSGAQFHHTYSKKLSLAYQIGANGHKNESYFIYEYFVNIHLRRLIHKTWFFAEFVPMIFWPKDKNWNRGLSIFFKVEAVFGG